MTSVQPDRALDHTPGHVKHDGHNMTGFVIFLLSESVIFLAFFAGEGCEMVEMTCEDHDKKAASTQFITHTVGRMLGEMGLEKTDIDTKGFESLLSLVENTSNDSFDLYYGLFMYNQNATEELDRLEKAFDDVKKQLFDQLRDVVRSQLFSDEQSRSAR